MNIESHSSIQSPATNPIYIIGAGGIVNDAHLPAYKLAGFQVAGIYDIDREKMLSTANNFSISSTFNNLDSLFSSVSENAVFDLAVPPSAVLHILRQIPENSAVLIQKPMGSNISEARQILGLSQSKNLIAAVNFQLRFAPAIMKVRELILSGHLGELTDIEININVYTPWNLWKFLYDAERVEILYHSIHYIDLVRSFLGNPLGIYAKTIGHPLSSQLASVRSNIIMDYGDMVRANILTNHSHEFGSLHEQSYVKFEGTRGAARISMGVLKNYPVGEEDKCEINLLDDNRRGEWIPLKIEGTWFPHAFIGSMKELLESFNTGRRPAHSVEDCIYTMACVEAAYRSSKEGGIKPGDFLVS